MEILVNKDTVISVLLRVCVIILEYKFREDTNGQTLKDSDGRNSVASCLQRHLHAACT